MKESLTSPTIRSGNVLALLDTLYTSGFAMGSPSTPMLNERTMHTLYALSFIVYVFNCISDWVHVVATLQGRVTSFTLDTWMAVSLLTVAVSGSMMTWLLLALCVENAFAHRLDVTPYRSGYALVLESVVEWIQAFNNFRVAFLMMFLHDGPMTLLNFFFIAGCRCPGPNVMPWTLLFSALTTTLSLFWRFTMLHFAYRRMLCPLRKSSATVRIVGQPSAWEHLQQAVDTHDPRLSEYDECWPVRFAKMRIFGPPVDEESPKSFQNVPTILTLPCVGYCASITLKTISFCKSAFLWFCVSLVTIAGYLAMLLTCCVPYFYHYTCRRNSFYHRHKCARSFIRYFSYIFHIAVFVFSVAFCVLLIILNLALMSSVHILGSSNAAPELDNLCISVLPLSRTIKSSVLPKPFFSTSTLAEIVNSELAIDDAYASTSCKPLWEDGGLGMGIKRQAAGPWQVRTKFKTFLLAVATQAVIHNEDPEHAHLDVFFDVAELSTVDGEDATEQCRRGNETRWMFLPTVPDYPFPYFMGCKRDIRFIEKPLIECYKSATMRTTTPQQGWKRRKNHRPRHGGKSSTLQ